MDRNRDIKGSLSGPILANKLFFLLNARFEDNKNHLNGIRRFLVDDFSDFTSPEPELWYSEANGDLAFVPLNEQKKLSFFSKLSFRPFPALKSTVTFTHNDNESQTYAHAFKYNPDGLATDHLESDLLAFQVNHAFSQKAFYELKISRLSSRTGTYVFENPLDAGYVHDEYGRSAGVGFLTGGQQRDHIERTLLDLNLKLDLFWQMHRQHSIKAGIWMSSQDLDQKDIEIRNQFFGSGIEQESFFDAATGQVVFPNYIPEVPADSSIYADIYNVQPRKGAAYIQDKMEFDDIVINAGIRLDYFDPNTIYPSQIRNPANQLQFEDPQRMSTLLPAKTQSQISPRLGFAYELGERALLRFAYGHFFQMPPLYAIYQNHSRLVPPGDYLVTTGNPRLKAQKTIQYEIGLWQSLTDNMNFEIAIYYRDIYDLLSAGIITTYNQIRYGLFTNKDYGNARGMEFKYEFLTNRLLVNLNYTLQFTIGNADDASFTFTRAGDSKDPVNRLIPMSWDQRHTLNASIGYRQPRFGATMTAFLNSGTPYTWDPRRESILARVNLFPNNAYKPARLSVDLKAHYSILQANHAELRLRLLALNVFDRLNDREVYVRQAGPIQQLLKNHKSMGIAATSTIFSIVSGIPPCMIHRA